MLVSNPKTFLGEYREIDHCIFTVRNVLQLSENPGWIALFGICM